MIRWLWDKMLRWGWDFNRDLRGLSPEVTLDRKLQASPEVRIAIYSAGNGKILELYKRDLNNHHIVGGDEFKLMIVPEGENLSDVVTMMLLAEGMR
jgi:hypothetical protein